MMREVYLETLPNVNIRDPSRDKNLPIKSVIESINHNVFKIDKSFLCEQIFLDIITTTKPFLKPHHQFINHLDLLL